MTETPKTAEQIVAERLAGGEKWFWEYPNTDSDRRGYLRQAGSVLSDLTAAGLLRTPGEPSDEQVERAARAMADANPTAEEEWEDMPDFQQDWYRRDARAALTAAGVFPQPVIDEAALAEMVSKVLGRAALIADVDLPVYIARAAAAWLKDGAK